MRHILVAISVSIWGSLTLCAAQGTEPQQACNATKWIRQISAPDGWRLQFVSKGDPDGQEESLDKIGSEYLGVTVAHYKLRKKRFEFPEVVVDECAQIASIKKYYMDIDEGFTFKRSGRIFAYRVVGKTVVLQNGEWIPCMCRFALTFYDSSGNGIFDELHVGEGAMGGPPPIPKWAK